MDTDKDKENNNDIDVMGHINKKLNTMSTGKKVLVICFLLLILGSIYYLTTIDRIETVDYKKYGKVMCTEVYVNGELNTTPCTEFYPGANRWNNNEQLNILGNLTLTQNLS